MLKQPLNFLIYSWQKYRQYFKYAVLMLLVLTVFESAQQYFYILRFDLAADRPNLFIDLMSGHFYRWLIWMLISIVFVLLLTRRSEQDVQLTTGLNGKVLIAITFLILLNIFIIAVVETLFTQSNRTMDAFAGHLAFYFFQKVPIYTLSYIALLAIYQLLNLKDNLQLEVVQLNQLNDRQQAAIASLENQPRTKDTTMLSIKVGNSYKMLAIDDICWLEAYDYCVKVHTLDEEVYAMRGSLKALEKQLSNKQFLRIHRKAIVNMQKAQEVVFRPSPKVVLNDKLVLDIAQSRIKAVKQFLA